MNDPTGRQEYKPNIYPIMYWAILYGVLCALALFVIKLLSDFITLLWFPVFLAGLLWGGFRKYKKDKEAWVRQGNSNPQDVSQGNPKSVVVEFKDAARDIAQASQEIVTRRAEDSQHDSDQQPH